MLQILQIFAIVGAAFFVIMLIFFIISKCRKGK